MNKYYIDYLDYSTIKDLNFEYQLLRFRFDLLLFADQQMLLSVPACVKLEKTTEVLALIDDFWKNGVLKLQLDEKHKANPMNYFYKRTKKLESNINEKELFHHFEYLAYTSTRTSNFYQKYLPTIMGKNIRKLYIRKKYDTDKLFRKEVKNKIIGMSGLEYDKLSRAISPMDFIKLQGILNDTIEDADQAPLFQRAVIENKIIQNYHPGKLVTLEVSDILDKSFAYANAYTNDAVPVTFIENQLTGKWLIKLLKGAYPNVYMKIISIPWDCLYDLAVCDEWKAFKMYINALIATLQKPYLVKDKVEIERMESIERDVMKAIKDITTYNLFNGLLSEVISKIKNQLKTSGLFYEINQTDVIIETLEREVQIKGKGDIYYLLKMIDALATLISVKVDTILRGYDFQTIAKRQQQKRILLRD